jgi:cytochrome c oxidase cbb3-type subunit 3
VCRALASGVALAALAGCRGGNTAGAPAGVRYDQHVSAGGLPPAATPLVNPFADDAASAAQGAQLFAAMNCDGCHGGGAVGFVGPSLVDGRWRYGGADGALFQSIQTGRPRGMPAYGGILPPDAIWKLVTYLRSLPVPEGVATQAW